MGTTDFPNKEAAVFVSGFVSGNNYMRAVISVGVGTLNINEMIDARLQLIEGVESLISIIILDRGTDYFTRLEQWESGIVYERVNVYQKFNGKYVIGLTCPSELYFENMKLPQELQLILDSFAFIE